MRMAKALSQEEVLDLLCQGGGKVTNASLLGHFKLFLRNPLASAEQQQRNREKFKRYVNSVAVVKQEGAVKYVVLRSRYRDLLGEDLRPPTPDLSQQTEHVHSCRELDQVVPAAAPSQDCTETQVGGGWSSQNDAVQWQGMGYGTGSDEIQSRTVDCLQHSIVCPVEDHCRTWGVHDVINGNPPSHFDIKPITCETVSESYPSSAPIFKIKPSPTPKSSKLTFSPSSQTSHSSKLTSSPSSQTSQSSKLTSSPSSQTSKSSNVTSSPSINHPSSCLPADNPALVSNNYNQSQSPETNGHWRQVPCGETRKELLNPVFVNTTYWDLQEQRLSCTVCSEPKPPSNQLAGINSDCLYSSKVEHNQHTKWKLKDESSQLPASPPLSRYTNLAHTAPSLLLRQDSGNSLPDVLLAEYQSETLSPSPPLPETDMRDLWMCQFPIFKSIRCQLSLQDLDEFVEQESCGSDGSDSGEGGDCDTEPLEEEEESLSSDSNKEKQELKLCTSNQSFLNKTATFRRQTHEGGLLTTNTVVEAEKVAVPENYYSKSPYIAKSFLTDQAPILFELAGNLPKSRIPSRAYEYISSSDDERNNRDFQKRRRPSRSKKTSIPLVAPKPDVDRLLISRPVSTNNFIVNNCLPESKHVQSQYISKGKPEPDVKKYVNYKSSLVPLDPMEHDWIVKSASGSWLQVYGMFTIDPQLALRKDFISGYTVLHWFAKHGCAEMFQKVVAGAKKAGIELNMNIKSTCGYTPLHIAAIHGHHKIAIILVEKLKANVKLRDNSGKRAWQYLGHTTSGDVWQLLGAPRGKTIFSSRALNTTLSTSSQLNRKASLAAFLKPQHQKWKANNLPSLREREIYSD
ncbi:ankyrin repeat domain-containing protein SOWAHB [Bombina bombina]|uniref:ankyrin repeat domain-containing protein SOWAHB n=1 Tax=Bombina bombina TaxID=8345 RepID=UPI00235AECF8|nr:ankyrin repeat domain-containing protein SOWAHB [Bombina bombina]